MFIGGCDNPRRENKADNKMKITYFISLKNSTFDENDVIEN